MRWENANAVIVPHLQGSVRARLILRAHQLLSPSVLFAGKPGYLDLERVRDAL